MAAEASAGNTTKSIESAVKRGEIHRFVAEMDGDIPEELSCSTLGLLGVQEFRAAGACRFELFTNSLELNPLRATCDLCRRFSGHGSRAAPYVTRSAFEANRISTRQRSGRSVRR